MNLVMNEVLHEWIHWNPRRNSNLLNCGWNLGRVRNDQTPNSEKKLKSIIEVVPTDRCPFCIQIGSMIRDFLQVIEKLNWIELGMRWKFNYLL